MTDFNRIKNLLNGSTTMPQGTAMGMPSNVHYHDGMACTHDHSHDHDNAGDHHHEDGACCGHKNKK